MKHIKNEKGERPAHWKISVPPVAFISLTNFVARLSVCSE
jgi:hypothetical protein